MVLHDDTVNTQRALGEMLKRLSINHLSPESIGKMRLRGKEEEVELFSFLKAA